MTDNSSMMPAEGIGRKPAAGRARAKTRSHWARGAERAVGAVATLLLVVSVGGYFYHRGQLRELAAEHLRLLVTGPARLHSGATNSYSVLTTSVSGDPLPAEVEFTLFGTSEKPLFRQKDQTSAQGRLQIAIPADLALPSAVRIEVLATDGHVEDRTAAALAVVSAAPRGRRQSDDLLRRLKDVLQTSPKGADSSTSASGKPSPGAQVRFVVDGDGLIRGVRNHVYFVGRDASGASVDVRGVVVDGRGEEVVRAEATLGGMGMFSFVPSPGGQYKLRVAQPAGVKEPIALPAVSVDAQVSLSVGNGIFEAGRPLEFNVESNKGELPLVCSASQRGVFVGQTVVVTESASQSNPSRIEVTNDLSGVIRLSVYDYRTSPPKCVAQRLVYRRRSEKATPAGDETVVEIDRLLSGNPKAASALDLVLGVTRPDDGDIRQVAQSEPKTSGVADAHAVAKPSERFEPPAMFDNLGRLREEYARHLADYRQQRTKAFDTITAASFFGGFALVLSVAMMTLLGIISGVRLWVPSLTAAISCLVLGAVMMNPDRFTPESNRAVPFCPYQVSPPEGTARVSPLGAERLADASYVFQ